MIKPTPKLCLITKAGVFFQGLGLLLDVLIRYQPTILFKHLILGSLHFYPEPMVRSGRVVYDQVGDLVLLTPLPLQFHPEPHTYPHTAGIGEKYHILVLQGQVITNLLVDVLF